MSLTHLVCWAPGFVLAIVDVRARGLNTSYGLWLHAFIMVIAISFLFDLKDAGGYFVARKVQPSLTRDGST